MKIGILLASSALFAASSIYGQVKKTSIPIGDAVNKSLAKTSLTAEPGQPFHIYVSISEPGNPQSPYQGSIEEWWQAPDRWRREVIGKDNLHQTIVVVSGVKTEKDTGDYFPLWLRNFVTAVFNPVPDSKAWTTAGLTIDQITLPNGAKSDACARAQSKIGSGDQAVDAFSNVCFDNEGRLKFVGSPRYSMEFHDYRRFGKKDVARQFVDDPEPGTRLVGEVTKLDALSDSDRSNLFAPLTSNDDRFQSAQVSSTQLTALSAGNLPISWPPVHSGNLTGRLALYISVDNQGKVREAWPLNSDNAGLEDSAREQVKAWKMKIAVDSAGNRVQVDGGLGFAFNTHIEDPLPQLTDAEIRSLAINAVEPVWAPGSVHAGQVIKVDIAVNQQGKLTGGSYKEVPPEAQGAIMNAISQWTFRPLIRNGIPQYFHGILEFKVQQ